MRYKNERHLILNNNSVFVLDGEEDSVVTLEDFSDLQELGVIEVLGDDRYRPTLSGFSFQGFPVLLQPGFFQGFSGFTTRVF